MKFCNNYLVPTSTAVFWDLLVRSQLLLPARFIPAYLALDQQRLLELLQPLESVELLARFALSSLGILVVTPNLPSIMRIIFDTFSPFTAPLDAFQIVPSL